VDELLVAYRAGFFPMADPEGRGGPPGGIVWFNPDPRGIIPLEERDGLHFSRRLRQRIRSRPFRMTCDTAFEAVMRGCAAPRPQEDGTWIDERFIAAYGALFAVGHAHSIEAWTDGPAPARLVGGLYGVHIGGAFFAESKFCRPADGGTDASKVCLAHTAVHLRRRGFTLLDTQFWNPHIDQFGCREIPREEYLARLAAATALERTWGPFDPDAAPAEL
jgi:leucyl/phenylalanyl-tRNA--protein transferase